MGGTDPQVSTYMHRQLDGAPPSVSVARIADMMRRDTLGSVLVESVDHINNETATIGIVTKTDLVI